MSTILFSSNNTSGMYLEDLLEQTINDLSEQHVATEHLTDLVSVNYRKADIRISELLLEAKRIREDALRYAKENTTFHPYTLNGVSVVASQLSYSEYIKHRKDIGVNFGTDFSDDGYLIITNKGKPNQQEWWLPTKLFIKYSA